MSNEPDTDRATVVPLAAPLTGEPAEPDQPHPSEVLPMGNATELENLKSGNEPDG
jgi:hypothetical protein